MELSVKMILWFFHFKKTKKTKTTTKKIRSNPENKTRAKRFSPANKGAAELFRSLPGAAYFRMSLIQFDILVILEPHMKKSALSFCQSVDPEQIFSKNHG